MFSVTDIAPSNNTYTKDNAPLFNAHPCTLEHKMWKVHGGSLAFSSLAHLSWEERKLCFGKKQIERYKGVA